MPGALALPLAEWESFYVVIGSAAAVLIGLQFVVIAIGAQIEGISSEALPAFATPTVVHFSAVFLIAAMFCAPWHTLAPLGLILTAGGVLGFVYMVRVLWQARQQTAYVPVLEDWLMHVVFPLIAYAVLVVAGSALPHVATSSLFVIAATALGLLFIGIHNSWDAVIYIATDLRLQLKQSSNKPAEQDNV